MSTGGASARPSFVETVSAVLANEVRLLFLSPRGWVFLAAFLLLGGMFFVVGLETTGEASLRPTMGNLVVSLLFCVPLVTMRQLAEEARSGTLELVLTAPVRPWAVVLGKWLAAMLLCDVLLVLSLAWPLVLMKYGDPDPGLVITAYLGLWLCCAAFTAAGLFASSLTNEQMVGGLLGVMLLLPFWLVGSLVDRVPEGLAGVLRGLSLVDHLRGFARGLLDLGDVAWFLGFTFLFLFLAWRSLESRRWR
ncbi:MAG: ABC transporter permease [Deltaproteobacteria bacterium]|nr:ABC transporter permease [Deltaproteobacteria bacterium]